jgi:hypothetical protein
MSAPRIRAYCEAIHFIVDRTHDGLGLFLDKSASLSDTDWSPDTIWMRRLASDANELRVLADRIDAERERLIGPTHSVAAE